VSQRRRRKKSSSPSWKRFVQVAIIGSVLLLVVLVLVLKGSKQAADPPAVAQSTDRATATLPEPQARSTATLPEAVGQTQATAQLEQAGSLVAATVLPDELPEAQLERLLAAGQPTLAFFHSNNCVQCIKMMEVVEQVYPEFDDSVALVDVNVRDSANTSLLQRAQIRAIPTQIFFDRTGQGTVIMGVMTPDRFREQMRTLAGGQ
jgi:thiol:disulfide interchange protein